MDNIISSTKTKNVIWEDTNLTELKLKSNCSGALDENDITTTINELSDKGLSLDITKARKKISGIYKIINVIDNKYYVGSSSDIIYYRWKEHKKLLKENKHHNKHLQNAWNKYGENNFTFKIIEELPVEKLKETEQLYLDICRSNKEHSYNIIYEAIGTNRGKYNPNYKNVNEIVLQKAKELWILFGRNKLRKFLNESGFGDKVMYRLIFIFKKDDDAFSKRQCNLKLQRSNIGKINGEIFRGNSNPNRGKHPSIETKIKIKNTLIKNKTVSGINHPRYDNTHYHFYNTISGEKFIGTRFDFYNKYDIPASYVERLVNGKSVSTKKWKLIII